MNHKSKTVRECAQIITVAVLLAINCSAFADTSAGTNCDVHAAAMVAEMKAGAATPMGEQEIALVRETARKSCLAQHGGNAPAAVVAAPKPATTAAPSAQSKADNSFFGTLGGIFSGPTDRKPGNQRLLDRSQH